MNQQLITVEEVLIEFISFFTKHTLKNSIMLLQQYFSEFDDETEDVHDICELLLNWNASNTQENNIITVSQKFNEYFEKKHFNNARIFEVLIELIIYMKNDMSLHVNNEQRRKNDMYRNKIQREYFKMYNKFLLI